jgi:hypothetical protein
MTDLFSSAKLYSEYESGVRLFRWRNLRGHSFENLTLNYIDFDNSPLAGSSFRRAKLRNANFGHCNLMDCNFEGADLRGADLTHADITCANFDGANLTDVKLPSVFGYRTASFKNAVGAMTFQRVGSCGRTLLVVKHGKTLWFKTGCFWGNERAFRRAIRDKHIKGTYGYGNKVFAREYWACIKEAHAKLDA